MPINKIKPTKRASLAIAGIVAIATGGVVSIFGGYSVPDDVALAVKIIQPWEGRSLKAYYDTIARPPVWTICDGDTDKVSPGMVETQEGCNKRLVVKLVKDYRTPVARCVGDWDRKPLSWRATMLTLSWNVGVGATCNSTAVRLAKVGKFRESCEAATAFNRAGGKVITGLVNRREMGDASRIGEAELCVSGL
ncbi:glycoside hydrolase family protein [Agrobacterium vitis]|uniref:lysozyme n=1 Tax=Agrobacterium vitis TaxID=373 RepID=UPI0012E896AB|nr:lysozyme [Agrobacterium vitis]MVA17407.1 glycoside hydrolase family protein [Agrobacterium vitis]